jgi:hypothetical protein
MAVGIDTRSNKAIKRSYQSAASRLANQYLYELGRKKPRYPVPAVRYEWDWYKNLGTGEIEVVLITYGVFWETPISGED